jgi:hypothetical protein
MIRYDRAYLLAGAKRNEVLSLDEIVRYGIDSFGDPDYVSLYGLKPAEWYARGVRVLGRTAVECTRDALADRIGRDVAAAAPAVPRSVVIDPFAGSANTLYWLARHLGASSRAVGCERDARVFAATRRNLAVVGFDCELREVGYERGLSDAAVGADELVVVFVAPPWGDALDAQRGLDLGRTQPPVTEIVDLVARTFTGRAVLLAIQVHESVRADTVAEVERRCAWSRLTIYDIDPPGRNHGVLLGGLAGYPGWDSNPHGPKATAF